MNNIEKLAIKAKKIEWQHERDNWYDSDWGLHIYYDKDDTPGEQYTAAWGEGDAESFATFEEAEDWCQNQIDVYVNRVAVVVAKALQSSEPVADAIRERDKLGYTVVNVIKKLDEISEQVQEIELDDILQVAIPMDDWAALQDALDGMTERANTHAPNTAQLQEPVAIKAIPFATVRSQDSLPNAMGKKRREYYMQELYPTYWPAHGTVLYRLVGMEANSFDVDRSAIALFTLPPASVPLEKYNKLLDALKEAKSVINSINKSSRHEVNISGERHFVQTEEWVNWAHHEILPMVEQAIAEAEGEVG